MKKVVIIGAFDRYNYGDNLMPILFEFFLEKSIPDFSERYELVYAALTNSDLTKYKAKRSIALSEVFSGNLDNIECVISIGGEVLCASSSSLALHMKISTQLHSLILLLRKLRLPFVSDFICKKLYNLPWEYPYIPKRLKSHIKIAFNTVGGGIPEKSVGIRLHNIKARLNKSDYLSVRDARTVKSVKDFCKPELYPDSAIVMSHFVNDDFLKRECNESINNLKYENYICFQAAPNKIGATAEKCVEVLKFISKTYGFKVKLLPIGYASGHDDVEFLRKVELLSEGEFPVLFELNLWEIMSVIRYSQMYLGTSLHGVITALSFSVPHMGLNRNVAKLDKFLLEWSIGPFKRCYSVSEIPSEFGKAINVDKKDLKARSEYLVKLGLENNTRLLNSLKLGE